MARESDVTQIGYVEIETAARPVWLELARAIGFEIVEEKDHLTGFRMDADRWARIHLREGGEERLSAVGWEASDDDAYQAVLQRLEQAGAQPRERNDLRSLRNVERIARFVDPDGVPGEIYCHPRTTIRSPFRSPEQVRFVAADMGMGHVTLAVRDVNATAGFYRSVLGLRLTEIADVGQLAVTFLRAGRRHHSLALAQTPSGQSGVDHVMVEVASLDDLGSIRDRLLRAGHPLSRDLGRHPTDGVISMYLATPAAFTLEVGWGSLTVDESTWETERYARQGWSWGHGVPGAPDDTLGTIE